jgi:hypothetical protein
MLSVGATGLEKEEEEETEVTEHCIRWLQCLLFFSVEFDQYRGDILFATTFGRLDMGEKKKKLEAFNYFPRERHQIYKAIPVSKYQDIMEYMESGGTAPHTLNVET